MWMTYPLTDRISMLYSARVSRSRFTSRTVKRRRVPLTCMLEIKLCISNTCRASRCGGKRFGVFREYTRSFENYPVSPKVILSNYERERFAIDLSVCHRCIFCPLRPSISPEISTLSKKVSQAKYIHVRGYVEWPCTLYYLCDLLPATCKVS